MKSEAVRIAEIKVQADTIREMLHNPVVEIIAAYVIIELLQRYPTNKPIMGSIAGTVAEAGCLAAVGMQQIAPLAPALAQGTESLSKAIPGLLALGMGA
jgi:hypothetical protein